MIMNQTPYPISFEQQMSQALVCRYGEEMRQYVFKPDIDVSGLSCLLQIAKTDGTFTENGVEVHTDPDTGECTLVITIPQQATVVKGLNRYSICVYGEIEGEDHLLYSAEGPLWVDDDLITDEMIQSVAEVNGLVFPQDFLTVENLVDIVNYVKAQIIDDQAVNTTQTWSSSKVKNSFDSVNNSVVNLSNTINAMKTGFDEEEYDSPAAMVTSCDQKLEDEIEASEERVTAEIDTLKDLLDYDDPAWAGSSPTFSNYSAKAGEALSGYELTLENGQTAGTNSRVGCQVLFNADFVGKKLVFEPSYTCTGHLSAFELEVNKQSSNDGVYTILDSNINHPKILLDFTNATETGIRYYYFRFFIKGKGVSLTQNTTIKYNETYTLTYYNGEKLERIDKIESDVEKIGDSLIVDVLTNNLINTAEIESNVYYKASDGSQARGANYLSSTGLIPVNAGKTYTLNRTQGTNPSWTFWDASKNFVSGQSNIGYSVTVPTGSNIVYMRASILMEEEATAMIVEGDSVDYNNYYSFGNPARYSKTQWFGKKAVTIGDSLTSMEYWQPMMKSVLGLNSYEKFAQHGGNMIAIANYIENIDADVDFVTIWAGTNDWAGDVPLGDFGTDNRNTYAGALGYIIDYLGTNRPLTKILFITPMQRFDSAISSWETDDRGNYINPTTEKTLEDFVNMVISYGNAYAIPVLDMYHTSGVNKYNMSAYSTDLLHPSKAGFQRLCWHIINKLAGI